MTAHRTASTPHALPDLATARERLLAAIRRALVHHRHVVELGELKLRFEKGGDTFEEDGKVLLALADGVFVKFQDGKGFPGDGGHWLHYGPVDNLENIAEPYLRGKSVMDLEALRVGISATAAMKSMLEEQRRAATSNPAAAAPTAGETRPARRPRIG